MPLELDAPRTFYTGCKAAAVGMLGGAPAAGASMAHVAVGSRDDAGANGLAVWAAPLSAEAAPAARVAAASYDGDVEDLRTVDDVVLSASSSGAVHVHRFSAEHAALDAVHVHERVHVGAAACIDVQRPGAGDAAIVTGGDDGGAAVLSAETGVVQRFPRADSSAVSAVRWVSPFTFLTLTTAGQLKMWDLRQGSAQPSWTTKRLADGASLLHCMDIHPTQTHIVATGCSAGVVTLWDARSSVIASKVHAHDSDIWRVRFHPTRPNNLVTTGDDGLVLWWNFASKGTSFAASEDSLVLQTIAKSAMPVTALDIVPTAAATYVVAGSDAESVTVSRVTSST